VGTDKKKPQIPDFQCPVLKKIVKLLPILIRLWILKVFQKAYVMAFLKTPKLFKSLKNWRCYTNFCEWIIWKPPHRRRRQSSSATRRFQMIEQRPFFPDLATVKLLYALECEGGPG